MADTEIAVIGAGVVGNSVALRLAQSGHAVTMVAPPELGDGASYGNAGVIADHAVLPAGPPELQRSLPALLVERMGPEALRQTLVPVLAPWLVRLARLAPAGAAGRNARAIAALLADSAAEWRNLAATVGATGLLRHEGALFLYPTARDLAGARADLAIRKAHGIRVEMIDAADLAQLEPGLPEGVAAGAAYLPDTLAISDPAAMLDHLVASVRGLGVQRIVARAETLRRRRSGGVEVTGPGFCLRAQRAVLAAGAYSRPLALGLGDRLPLFTERGYHLEFDMPAPAIRRPVTPVGMGFSFCPLQGRLRVAGTVEQGGLPAAAEPHRLARLEQGARRFLPGLAAPTRSWLGVRPSVPDHVPVIGPSRGGAEVVMAFGHGHLGLTLAPVTARIIAALIDGRPLPLPLGPYLPARF